MPEEARWEYRKGARLTLGCAREAWVMCLDWVTFDRWQTKAALRGQVLEEAAAAAAAAAAAEAEAEEEEEEEEEEEQQQQQQHEEEERENESVDPVRYEEKKLRGSRVCALHEVVSRSGVCVFDNRPLLSLRTNSNKRSFISNEF
jgi:hypothetical protein